MSKWIFRRRWLPIGSALLIALASCQQAGGGGSSASISGTLTYWSMWNPGEPQMQVLDKDIKDFEKANPSVKVNVLWGGRQILSKVRTALLSGNPPDLVDKDADDVGAALINPGQAVPLDDVVSAKIDGENKTIADVVPKSNLDQFYKNGHFYLIPYEVISSGFWYSGSYFTQLGVNPPQTFSDLLDLVHALKAKNVPPIAQDGNIDFDNAYFYYWLSERYGGPGALHKAAGDKSGAAWDDPIFLNAAKGVQQLVEAGAFQPGYQGSKYPAAQTAWAQGKMATLLMGSWAPSETGKFAAPGFNYRMFAFPTVPSGHNSVEVYLVGWSVPKGAKNAAAAKKFISFAMNKDRLQGIVDVALNLTPRPDLGSPPDLKDVKALLDSGAPTNRVWDAASVDYPGWWKTVFLPLDDSLLFGQIKASEFIRSIKQQSIDYWQTHTS